MKILLLYVTSLVKKGWAKIKFDERKKTSPGKPRQNHLVNKVPFESGFFLLLSDSFDMSFASVPPAFSWPTFLATFGGTDSFCIWSDDLRFFRGATKSKMGLETGASKTVWDDCYV